MTRSSKLSPEERRFLASADLDGDANGRTSLKELAGEVAKLGAAQKEWDPGFEQRKELAESLLARAPKRGYLIAEAELRNLPPAVRRLAIAIDCEWGNADGKISIEEIERVARYVLAALPFFTREASALIELGDYLGFNDAPIASKLRAEVKALTKDQVEAAQPFRALLDQAIKEAAVPGAPEMLTDALRHSPRWHSLSILEHTAAAVEAAVELGKKAGIYWPEIGAVLLLHDVGKILTRTLREPENGGSFGFTGHEKFGADWVCEKLGDSELVFQIEHHGKMHLTTVEEFAALAGGDQARLQRMLVVWLADRAGHGATGDQLQSFQDGRDKFLTLANMAGLDGPLLYEEVLRLQKIAAEMGEKAQAATKAQ